MAHSLVNSAPLVIGIDDPHARHSLSRYVFSVSRALIGNELADALGYPSGKTLGVLEWFRIQAKYERVLDRLVPRGMRNRNFSNFTSLLEASMFDEAGISYGCPTTCTRRSPASGRGRAGVGGSKRGRLHAALGGGRVSNPPLRQRATPSAADTWVRP